MTASRYAVSATIPEYQMRQHPERYIAVARDRVRHELGRKLVEVNEEMGSFMTVKLTWEEPARVDWDNYRFALVATIWPVEVERIRIAEYPPMDLSYQPADLPTLAVEWQCDYCGQTNLVAEHLECRRCGGYRKPMR